jgi:hypothetical protein
MAATSKLAAPATERDELFHIFLPYPKKNILFCLQIQK